MIQLGGRNFGEFGEIKDLPKFLVQTFPLKINESKVAMETHISNV